MTYQLVKEYQYIPEWNGNKTDPEPIKFNMRLLTTEERMAAIEYSANGGEIDVKPDKRMLVLKGVKSIESFIIGDEEIKTPGEWLRAPSDMALDTLFTEIWTEVLTKNFRDKKK